MQDALAIGNYFLNKSRIKNRPISLIKINKLIYIANGFYLAENNIPLIKEQFIARGYGPILDVIWDYAKIYGTKEVTDVFRDDFGEVFKTVDLTSNGEQLLNNIWLKLGDLDIEVLTRSINTIDGAFAKTRKDCFISHQDLYNQFIGYGKKLKTKPI